MRTALALLCIVMSATTVRAQSHLELTTTPVDANTRRELETARESVWRAWFAGDIPALERLIPAGLAAGSSSGWEDRGATIEGSRRSAASGRRLVEIRFDSTSIRLRGNVAVMQAKYVYILQARDGKRDTTRGIATEVFVRDNKRWVNPFWYLD